MPTMRHVLAIVLLLTACATANQQQPPVVAPKWDAVPATILDAFCARLQMDAIATGAPLTIVQTTAPLATQQSMNALLITMPARVKVGNVAGSAADANRSMPIVTEGSACGWRAIPASEKKNHADELLVELSAPALHPFSPRRAGLFARVTLGGENPAWYWINLVPYGDRWRVSSVSVLVQ